jgi:hypothetical protein
LNAARSVINSPPSRLAAAPRTLGFNPDLRHNPVV